MKISIPRLIPYGPIYPEFMVEREAVKMEILTGKKRTREDVFRFMEKQEQKPMKLCLGCQRVCIQRQVVGLVNFKCYVRETK